MDISVGDTIYTREKAPLRCGRFEVLRRGGWISRIRCTGCRRGSEMLPRAKIEKNIKKVVKPGQV